MATHMAHTHISWLKLKASRPLHVIRCAEGAKQLLSRYIYLLGLQGSEDEESSLFSHKFQHNIDELKNTKRK